MQSYVDEGDEGEPAIPGYAKLPLGYGRVAGHPDVDGEDQYSEYDS
jgi:hypothetical protein